MKELIETELTENDLIAEDINSDIYDYISGGKYIVEIEEYEVKAFFGLTKRIARRLFVRKLDVNIKSEGEDGKD